MGLAQAETRGLLAFTPSENRGLPESCHRETRLTEMQEHQPSCSEEDRTLALGRQGEAGRQERRLQQPPGEGLAGEEDGKRSDSGCILGMKVTRWACGLWSVRWGVCMSRTMPQ